MVAALVDADQHTLTSVVYRRQETVRGRRDTQGIEAVISRTYENGKMRHMAVEIGPDGWMDVLYVPS